MFNPTCHNPNIGFATKCECKAYEAKIMSLGMKHTLTSGGECKRLSPMIPNCILT